MAFGVSPIGSYDVELSASPAIQTSHLVYPRSAWQLACGIQTSGMAAFWTDPFDRPDDVAFFFVLNTTFDAYDFTRYLVLHVGTGPAKEQVDAAVRRYVLNKKVI